MKEPIPWVIALLTLIMTARYCWQSVRGQIAPTLSTWLIFLVATILQLLTYQAASEKNSWTTNIFATIDTLSVALTVFTLYFFGKKVIRQFSRIDAWCLIAAGIIWIGWLLGMTVLPKSSHICNFAIQAIMVIAYVPTWRKLWRSTQKTEPYVVWSINEITALLGLYLVASRQDPIAIMYTARAAVSVMIVLLLLVRLDVKMKSAGPKAPS